MGLTIPLPIQRTSFSLARYYGGETLSYYCIRMAFGSPNRQKHSRTLLLSPHNAAIKSSLLIFAIVGGLLHATQRIRVADGASMDTPQLSQLLAILAYHKKAMDESRGKRLERRSTPPVYTLRT
jgi:hypothetical protein